MDAKPNSERPLMGIFPGARSRQQVKRLFSYIATQFSRLLLRKLMRSTTLIMLPSANQSGAVKERQHSLQQASSHEFDIVVVGGGIAGAGIAQNAASRGMSVLLLEKNDFASAASGKSNQLIPAAIPQLEQLLSSQARQYAEERERSRKLAPHLIQDVPFLLPFTGRLSFEGLKAAAGQRFYDLMRRRTQADSQAILNKKTLAKLVPAISTKQVSGGIQYSDLVTDDARFVLAVLEAAQTNGALALNYVQATGLHLEEGKLTGLQCRDRNSGQEFSIKAKICVNAAGVWSGGLSEGAPAATATQSYAKCTQIIVPRSAFETNSAILFPAGNGKFVHLLPWKHAVLIGSADAVYTGDPDHVQSSEAEIDYLLDTINEYTEVRRLSRADISGVMTALSPLGASGKSAGETQAGYPHKIDRSAAGIFSVSSSLSDYRIMSEDLLQQLSVQFPGLSRRASSTQEQMLGGWCGRDDFPASSTAIEVKGKRLKIDPASIAHLIENYGKQAEHIVDLIEQQPSLNTRIIADFPPLMAEIPYAVVNEMALCLQDFFFRRTRLALLNQKQSLQAAAGVAELMGKFLHWDSRRTNAELAALEAEVYESEHVRA